MRLLFENRVLREALLPFQCVSFASLEIWLDFVEQSSGNAAFSGLLWYGVEYHTTSYAHPAPPPPHKKKSGADKSGQRAGCGTFLKREEKFA